MPLTMLPRDDAFHPAAVCDACGRAAGSDGFLVWAVQPDEQPRYPSLVACGDECLLELVNRNPEVERVGTPLDAYLVTLMHHLAIDPAAVLAREEADRAITHTRNESPE